VTTTIDPVAFERAELVGGLRQFADFLDSHPAVPPPSRIRVWLVRDDVGLGQWVDGCDELELAAGQIPAWRFVQRTFGGLTVEATVNATQVGVVSEVTREVTETDLVPFTVAEIIRAGRSGKTQT
jgi:hypothetical protein